MEQHCSKDWFVDDAINECKQILLVYGYNGYTLEWGQEEESKFSPLSSLITKATLLNYKSINRSPRYQYKRNLNSDDLHIIISILLSLFALLFL